MAGILTDHLLSLGSSGTNGTNCSDGIGWIWRVMGQCVEDDVQLAGFIIGFVSLLLWLVPLIPQLYENYRLQSAEGLSIYFLLFWMCGDTLNMVGAILTQQLEIQIYIGVYYIIQDLLLFSQYLYYTLKTKRNLLREAASAPSQTLSILFLLGTSGTFLGIHAGSVNSKIVPGPGQRRLLRHAFFKGAEDETGYIIGTLSALSYFGGRVPQVIKNQRRQSTEGVSIAMFVIIVLGNLTYGMSVLFQGWGQGWWFVMRHFPWLLGSLGCCFLDFIVIIQALYYKRLNSEKALPEDSDVRNLLSEPSDNPEI